jgi:transcriptional regulator with XRE-family HTH domain
MTQLDLAGAADISARHLSFLETGRSLPSRAMLLRLAERLEVPLRERNPLLISAGYAPLYSEKKLEDPSFANARKAIELLLAGHEPYPALCINKHWSLLLANRAVAPFLMGAEAKLLEPPVNVLRLSLHPGGLGSRIENIAQWKAHVLARLRSQVQATGDDQLIELMRELEAYPVPSGESKSGMNHDATSVVVPLKLRTEGGMLEFVSTTTVFGTPLDITLAELAIESFFPANAATAEALRQLARPQD